MLRLITDTPTSKIRSIAMGPVEVCGAVVPAEGGQIEAPFSGRPCVYCWWTVEEYKESKKSGDWEVVNEGRMGKYFFVKDDTGCVLVEPDGAKVDLHTHFTMRTMDDRIRKFLESKGIKSKSWIFERKLRFREYLLKNGDYAYVMGYAGDNPYIDENTSTEQADVMIQKKNGCVFFISCDTERALIRKYEGETFLGIFGGVVIFLIGLYLLWCLGVF